MSGFDELEELSPQERLDRLKAYMDMIREGRPPMADPTGEILESTESTTESLGRGLTERTKAVHEAMYDGADAAPSLEAIEEYEALIAPKVRPALFIQGDQISEPDLPMWEFLEEDAFRARITTAAKSIGRIEVPGHPRLKYAGTGFLVGDGLLLTNRHVAQIFAPDHAGRSRPLLSHYKRARVDFLREHQSSARERLDVTEVVWVHPVYDAALLRVDGAHDKVALTLDAETHAADLRDRELVVIGYPARDPRNDTRMQDEIFRHVYNVKRALPGQGKGERQTESYDETRMVNTLGHDASTLGGASGSAVIDLHTGLVVGLHFGGSYLKVNHAVSARDLVRDPQVVDGLNFEGDPADPDEDVHNLWVYFSRAGTAESAVVERAVAAVDAPPHTGAVQPGAVATSTAEGALDWYLSQDDAALVDALRRDRTATERLIRAALPADEAAEALFALAPEDTEESVLEAPAPDPSLPEILFLHGIMGSHLVDELNNDRRSWFDLRAFALRDIATHITLRPDGMTDAANVRLRPGGHLGMPYRRATRLFRAKGFVVHPFSYDWRKPLDLAASALHHYIEGRLAQRPGARFVIVAHSMGGLVAATYANNHPSWQSRIDQAVLVGSPLGGSFAPLQAVQGTYPFFKTLAWLALWNNTDQLRVASATLPGLLTMLPDPELIASAAPAYESAVYGSDAVPGQLWLTRARRIKQDLRSSPLLARTTAIVCPDIGTVVEAHDVDGQLHGKADPDDLGPGDGTVPLVCAAIPELTEVYAVSGVKHDGLLADKGVINAVIQQIQTGSCGLPRLDRTQESAMDLAQDAFDEAILATPEAEALRERVANGEGSLEDLRWLREPIGAVPNG